MGEQFSAAGVGEDGMTRRWERKRGIDRKGMREGKKSN